MTRRLLAVALLGSVLLAGCTAVGSPAASPTTDADAPPETPGSTSPTPTTDPCPPPGNLSEKSLPERPSNFDRSNVVEFVRAYERVTTWNRLVDDDKISLGVGVSRTSVVNATPNGYVLHLEGGLGFETCLDGAHVAGDGIVRTNYFVNGTTLVRLDDPPNRTSDPRDDGTVVERWG